MSKPKPIIVSFDGNIGSGKSTIVKYFENNFIKYINQKGKDLKVCFLPEPVHIWETIKDTDGQNAIQKFYADNEKYAFPFQMMAYISRLSIFKKAVIEEYDIIFTERSVLTDRNIFAKMLYNSGKMNEIEYQIYNMWFDEFAEIVQNTKTVYIRTSPVVCKTRIDKRARSGEANIPLSYLENCHEYHEEWLSKGNDVLIIDGNAELDPDYIIYENVVDLVYKYVVV